MRRFLGWLGVAALAAPPLALACSERDASDGLAVGDLAIGESTPAQNAVCDLDGSCTYADAGDAAWSDAQAPDAGPDGGVGDSGSSDGGFNDGGDGGPKDGGSDAQPPVPCKPQTCEDIIKLPDGGADGGEDEDPPQRCGEWPSGCPDSTGSMVMLDCGQCYQGEVCVGGICKPGTCDDPPPSVDAGAPANSHTFAPKVPLSDKVCAALVAVPWLGALAGGDLEASVTIASGPSRMTESDCNGETSGSATITGTAELCALTIDLDGSGDWTYGENKCPYCPDGATQMACGPTYCSSSMLEGDVAARLGKTFRSPQVSLFGHSLPSVMLSATSGVHAGGKVFDSSGTSGTDCPACQQCDSWQASVGPSMEVNGSVNAGGFFANAVATVSGSGTLNHSSGDCGNRTCLGGSASMMASATAGFSSSWTGRWDLVSISCNESISYNADCNGSVVTQPLSCRASVLGQCKPWFGSRCP